MKYKCSIQSVWIIVARQCISPAVTVKGIKKYCISSAVDESDDNVLQNGSKEDGVLGALTVKMETVTLIGTGIYNLT